MHAKLLQSCPAVCDPVGCNPLGNSVQRILQASILEWVAIASSRGSSQHRDRTLISLCFLHWQVGSLLLAPLGTLVWLISYIILSCCLVTKLCLTLLWPGASVLGTSQARILEWVAVSFPKGSSWPRDQTWVSCIGRWILYHWATRKPIFWSTSAENVFKKHTL